MCNCGKSRTRHEVVYADGSTKTYSSQLGAKLEAGRHQGAKVRTKAAT